MSNGVTSHCVSIALSLCVHCSLSLTVLQVITCVYVQINNIPTLLGLTKCGQTKSESHDNLFVFFYFLFSLPFSPSHFPLYFLLSPSFLWIFIFLPPPSLYLLSPLSLPYLPLSISLSSPSPYLHVPSPLPPLSPPPPFSEVTLGFMVPGLCVWKRLNTDPLECSTRKNCS